MKIGVLLKQVPDTESVIQLSGDGKRVETEEIKWVVNPYDEYALEEALRIRESRDDVSVTALSAGEEAVDHVIRTAFALGVDEGIRIDTAGLTLIDPLGTARILAAALKTLDADLILAGIRAVDDDHYQVPAMIAEMLELPLITGIVGQQLEDGSVTCRQPIDGGFRTVAADLPALLTAQKGLNEPRYPNMKAIMKARKRPVTVKRLAEIGLDADSAAETEPLLRIASMAYAPERGQGLVIEGETPAAKAGELVRLLKRHTEIR